MPCIVVSFLSHYRYCLRMLRLRHSLVKGAAANPKTHTYVRIMRSQRVTTPEALMIWPLWESGRGRGLLICRSVGSETLTG
jgi:hypothetical protein